MTPNLLDLPAELIISHLTESVQKTMRMLAHEA